jgi:hypothetical protein
MCVKDAAACQDKCCQLAGSEHIMALHSTESTATATADTRHKKATATACSQTVMQLVAS